ncbi:MAG: DUF2849 domain-containing protein [Acidimicrobiales bacterium]|nr:DUF2849 domain-containing protein [Hyphomonadaceae bacterium]RZV38509.1 MAG: DUF2849 domain-containing protein [Acidimicrobiales bacterium]
MSTLKHKGKGPQAITANGLRNGPVVYLDPNYQWSTSFDDALISEDPDIIEKMRHAGDAAENANLVVGVYFIDVSAETGLPVRYRERFRTNGPSYDPGTPPHDSFVPTFIGG